MNDSFNFQIKLSSQLIVFFNLNTHICGFNINVQWDHYFISIGSSIGALSEDVLDVKQTWSE